MPLTDQVMEKYWRALDLKELLSEPLNLKASAADIMMLTSARHLEKTVDGACKIAYALHAEIVGEFLEQHQAERDRLEAKRQNQAAPRERVRFAAALADQAFATAYIEWLRDTDFSEPCNRKKWCALEFVYDMMLICGILDGKCNGCHHMIVSNLTELTCVVYTGDSHL